VHHAIHDRRQGIGAKAKPGLCPKRIDVGHGRLSRAIGEGRRLARRHRPAPTSKGWRIRYDGGGKRTVIDGPFTETKKLIAGYTIIQVHSREEALEWTRRFPAPFGDAAPGEIEVRQLFDSKTSRRASRSNDSAT